MRPIYTVFTNNVDENDECLVLIMIRVRRCTFALANFQVLDVYGHFNGRKTKVEESEEERNQRGLSTLVKF